MKEEPKVSEKARQLMVAFADASFECGEQGTSEAGPWKIVFGRSQAADKTLTEFISELEKDAARWRFVLPFLAHQLRGGHGGAPEMHLAIGEKMLGTGKECGMVTDLVTLAVDAAMERTPL